MHTPDRSLELSGEQLRELVDLAMERIGPFIDSLPEQPAWNVDDAERIARCLDEDLPASGQPANELLDALFEKYIPVSFNTAGPGYLAYVSGGGLPHSAAAELIANAVNRFASVWIAAPAIAQLEATVVRWFCDIVGYGKDSGGFLTTGGSLANWSGIVTARRCRLGEDFLRGTIYTSCQAHHSIEKAAMLAGFPQRNLRAIEVDADFRIRLDGLQTQIERDRQEGLQPFAIVGHAGTTNTGAVDPLDALADVAKREGLWLHVDAAYGGFFMLTERGRQVMRGIERADSITLDPHKGLFLPYGTGSLLVRDAQHLRQAHAATADYMPPSQQTPELVDFCDISPELSRDWRGLRVWLPIKMHGIGVFRTNLDEKLDLAAWAEQELRKLNDRIDDELEIVAAPQLSTVAFRLVREGLSLEDTNRLNQQLRDRINAGRRVLLTPAVLDGRYAIRICVLSFRTHQEHLETCLAEIERAIGELS